MMAGSETETAGVTGKLKEMTGSEAEMVVGMESGADTEAGMDLESTADRSGAGVGAEASARCAITSGGGDAGVDLRLVVAGTVTGDNVAAVAKVQAGSIAEMIPPECVAASEFAAAANAGLGSARTETERVGSSEMYTGSE